MDTSKDSVGAAPLLITLLEGVEMTEKQLAEKAISSVKAQGVLEIWFGETRSFKWTV
ncbi:BnaC03g14340D [Brassica napus]|uniref:(rape) hypothetical protein n=1 Tax=Brassica napus TaxID=3708 RepID=A0A078FIS6_BRANA|nr:unnamed protein product [Brassica napus]CDY12008.1 BnaC03g14340D [Brassica napus]